MPLSLSQQQLPQNLIPRPQSTLSLNQLRNRRNSNPDIYPGTRRFSTSFSDEDILSNDQLDQIHFDPRYRDYRSASSLNNSNHRSRSNSLHSMASTGNIIMPQYQPFRRVSSQSPPLISAPLIPQKRWDTNPSIFIEEYCDDDHANDDNERKSESIKSEEVKNTSKETLCTSNESLERKQQPALSVNDIKSFGDLSQIPFIDDDSNDSAPCRIFSENELAKKQEIKRDTCRKTVSFDIIKSGPAHQHLYSRSTSHGKNFPPKQFFNPHTKFNYIDKNPPPQLFHAASANDLLMPSSSSSSYPFNRTMSNVRTSKDGYVDRAKSVPTNSKPPFSFSSSSSTSSSSCSSLCYKSKNDHCTLVDKLIRIKTEERLENQHHHKMTCTRKQNEKRNKLIDYKIKWDEINGNANDDKHVICSGKVKALTSYFNTLPYMSNECNCTNITHQSTPNLSMTRNGTSDGNKKLSNDEMAIVREQLKEWSEYGLNERPPSKEKLVCNFLKRATSSPSLCLENEIYGDCKQYHDVLNRLNKVKREACSHHLSLSNVADDVDCIENPYRPDCFLLRKEFHCHPTCDKKIIDIPRRGESSLSFNSEKHKCRSACYNFRDPAKKRKKKIKEMFQKQQQQKIHVDDDIESLII